MVMMVMMVMMVVRGVIALDMAVFGSALLADGFGFDRCVADAVAEKFFADRRFCRCRFTVDDGVHRQSVVFAVEAPYVDMVNADDALQFAKMSGKRVDVDVYGRFFKEDREAFTEVFDSRNEYEQGDADRHNGIKQREVRETHHDSTHENDGPTENVFQHVKIDRALIKRAALSRKKCRTEIDDNADDGEKDHTVVMDLRGRDDAGDGIVDDCCRAEQQNEGGEDAAHDRKTHISVGVFCVGFLLALFFKEKGDPDTACISDVVNGVGEDGDASRQYASDKLKQRKSKVQKKSGENISFGFHSCSLHIFLRYQYNPNLKKSQGGGCKKQTEQTVKYGISRDGQASFFESRVRYLRGETPYCFLKLLEKCEKFSNPDAKQISVSVFSDDCISRSA